MSKLCEACGSKIKLHHLGCPTLRMHGLLDHKLAKSQRRLDQARDDRVGKHVGRALA